VRRDALYSRAARKAAPPEPPPAPAGKAPASSWRDVYKRHRKSMLVVVGAFAFVAMLATLGMRSAPPVITQADIDAAVVRALQEKTLPSPATKAYAAVRASVVRVRAGADSLEQDEYAERAVGSGVVVVESGIILTNLHVVAGARRIVVEFADGQKSEAKIVSAQPENDLAVIQAAVLPDDLKPATLGSSTALVEGDHVVAVGFPFGIGPSVSAGVVSGLRREYRSPAGERMLSDLIQFDAAANPGSSGGPLVNAAGEVVGIVTAILSPGEEGTFAGIAFAVPIQTAARAAGLPPF
jgi:S1-C subfamily serine protease